MFEGFLKVYNYLKDEGLEDPLIEALRLFDLLSEGALREADVSLLDGINVDLREIVEKRKDGVPIEYILGRANFMGLALHCTPDTLIPRAETELLVKAALDIIAKKCEPDGTGTVIEVGTGCGNIAVALAMNTDHVRILASDISDKAVVVAKQNIDEYGFHERVSLFCGDLFAPVSGQEFMEAVDVIVCNPPYIPTSSLQKLDPDIIDNEPLIALDAGAYGIDFFRRLITEAIPLLRPGGALVFEIGAGQEKLVDMLFKKNGNYEDIAHLDDGTDIRVISAVKKSPA